MVGDLEDLERLVRERGADLIVANSHGAEIARRTGAALLRAGFPIYDSYGAHAKPGSAMAGARRSIFAAANLLAAPLPGNRVPTFRATGQEARDDERRSDAPC